MSGGANDRGGPSSLRLGDDLIFRRPEPAPTPSPSSWWTVAAFWTVAALMALALIGG